MSMLNIGTSALLTTQASLSTTSHNISNVNTDGYNRQRVTQGTQTPNFEGGYYIGSGVTVNSVERIFDSFLSDQVRIFTSQEKSFDTFSTFARQVDDLLGAPELSLSSGLQGFFDAVQDVANDPTSIPARQVMLTEADTLAKRFNTLDTQLNAFNEQVNLGLDNAVKDVNIISQGIADLNQAITEASGGGGIAPNDLLDQRDQLINQLSGYISVSTNVQSNGAVNVFIGNGQALVVGQSAIALKIITNPLDSTRSEVGYGPSNINVSAQLTGGSIGGLLNVRQEVIDPARSEIDALAAGMIDTINAQHTVGLTLDGNTGGNFFEPTDASIQDAGSIRIAITNPRDIAVAFPVSTTTNINNSGTAQLNVTKVSSLIDPANAQALASDVQFSFASDQYTITYQGETAIIPFTSGVDSGKSYDLSLLSFTGGITAPDLKITLSGVPANDDSFTISNSNNGGFTAVGDNRNALALGELQITKTLNQVNGVATRSFGDAYGILVANVATRTHQAEVGQQTQKGLLDQTNLRYESVSGVNLDEEAANLIKFQQAYQAASQIITVSNTVFNSLMSAM
ncbi:MAG: flagellar hook-associated protein FlgK [Pseudomonadota bacterium]|nr:flagellar hook-associated protein FlgK [Pseudomonadota bacterium]